MTSPARDSRACLHCESLAVLSSGQFGLCGDQDSLRRHRRSVIAPQLDSPSRSRVILASSPSSTPADESIRVGWKSPGAETEAWPSPRSVTLLLLATSGPARSSTRRPTRPRVRNTCFPSRAWTSSGVRRDGSMALLSRDERSAGRDGKRHACRQKRASRGRIRSRGRSRCQRPAGAGVLAAHQKSASNRRRPDGR